LSIQVNENVHSPRIPTEKPTRVRYLMLILVVLVTSINYLDRTNLSTSAPYMEKDLGLSASMLGILFSAFTWSYVPMQIPTGFLLDRYGPRIVYGIALMGWSLFTLSMGYINSFTLLILARIIIGFFESPAFPSNGRIVTAWFPAKERGLAVGSYICAQYIGTALLTPVLTWIIATHGWKTVFIVTGLAGIVIGIIWFIKYRDPKESSSVNQAELDLISEGGGLSVNTGGKEKIGWKQFIQLFNHRELLVLYLCNFAVGTNLWFFITWFPSYLVMEKHLKILQMGFYAALPFLGAMVGVLTGGWFSGWMISKGKSISVARKLPPIVGLVLAGLVICADFFQNINIVISFMTLAFFGLALANGGSWTLFTDIVPRKLVGLAGGVFNTSGSIPAFLTPLIVGFIIDATKSFYYALIYVGVIALVGALGLIFLIGKPQRIEIELDK
jgi:ACS family D-galactonate transporter-like MFS transporter